MPRTLIIDDDPDFHALCRNCIGVESPLGDHEFLFAKSDSEALEILSSDIDLDIAIVSIDGKEISGMNLFYQLKDKRRVPRIAITEGRDLPTIRAAMNQGAADFLTKPVARDDLLGTVNKVFGDCEARREAWRTEAQLSALRRELDIAGDIQKRILPTELPDHTELELGASLTPARRMSGDFYDFFEITPTKLGLAVADVSGKGVPAAFFMAVARTLLRATAMNGAGPADCLAQVNKQLCQHQIHNMFVSVFYCELDTETWDVIYANGGHLPPYHIRPQTSEVTPLTGGDGTVLGVQDGLVDFREDRFHMERGDAIFFYTDGVTEAFDSERNQFSDERLVDYLLQNCSSSAHALTENVFAFVDLFTKGAEQSDDITSLAIKRF